MVEVWKNSTGGALPPTPTAIGGRYRLEETGVSVGERGGDAQLAQSTFKLHHLNSEGDRRLRRIARAGQQWKRSIGRRVDMEGMFCVFISLFFLSWCGTLISLLVYVYRLALEWARLVADDREAMGFTP